ncbi:CPBP family intramembrane glutamic endopeptidase [Caviibacterium pharyngocola]|uniref:CPBP family intramembrane metalloprotease n=1 Tax=Caviibacterium pharyngocola TaxID=28159 RepID=A0A2M8RVK5_9PAST|nr:CPBP family intramembrane glutamic endopeptidase [Caviibacterium pharyngocola]PJG82915.1 CPBP family intramembrane metalloprotease [Caviibacterium pharyngocola]
MPKQNDLTFVDLLFLCVVFFGAPIFFSLLGFLQLEQSGAELATNLDFSDSDNKSSIYLELVSLSVAAIYLYWRKFDFHRLHLSLDRYTLLLTLALILIAGGITQIFYDVTLPTVEIVEEEIAQPIEYSSYFSLSLILFSLLNGFYEEVFFLGLAFAVSKNRLPYVLIFSLFVRFSFHTYQGITSALGITLFGLIFLAFRFRLTNLVPFMLAHAFFDVFGLGLPLWLIP